MYEIQIPKVHFNWKWKRSAFSDRTEWFRIWDVSYVYYPGRWKFERYYFIPIWTHVSLNRSTGICSQHRSQDLLPCASIETKNMMKVSDDRVVDDAEDMVDCGVAAVEETPLG